MNQALPAPSKARTRLPTPMSAKVAAGVPLGMASGWPNGPVGGRLRGWAAWVAETPAAPARAENVAALTKGTNALPEPNTRPRGSLAASARCSSVSGRKRCIPMRPAAFSASWASASLNREAWGFPLSSMPKTTSAVALSAVNSTEPSITTLQKRRRGPEAPISVETLSVWVVAAGCGRHDHQAWPIS